MKKHTSKQMPNCGSFNYAIFDTEYHDVPFAAEFDIFDLDPQIVLEALPSGKRLRVWATGPAVQPSKQGKTTPFIAHLYGFGGPYKYQSRFISHDQTIDKMKASALFGFLPRPMILKIRASYTGFYVLYPDAEANFPQLQRISEDFARSLLHGSLGIEGFDPMPEKKQKPKVWYENLGEVPMVEAKSEKIPKGSLTVVVDEVPVWAAAYADTWSKLTEESKNMLKVCTNEDQAIAVLGAYAKGLEQGQEHAQKAAEQKLASYESAKYQNAIQELQGLQQAGYAGDAQLASAYESESTMIWKAVHGHAQAGTFETPAQRKKALAAKLAAALAPARAPDTEPKRNLKLKQVK